jgi:hypothetical protein
MSNVSVKEPTDRQILRGSSSSRPKMRKNLTLVEIEKPLLIPADLMGVYMIRAKFDALLDRFDVPLCIWSANNRFGNLLFGY